MHPTLQETRDFIGKYVTFTTDDYSLVGTLWAAATHLWQHFDAFPYLAITAMTKRSGKTRFSEILSMLSERSRNCTGVTAATVFRMIRDESPTLFIDEAESLSKESADETLKAILNVGYRKGQTIPRTMDNAVVHWPVFCPKAFVLIGDVNNTLRDRSIVILMQRGQPRERFVFDKASLEGEGMRHRLAELIAEHKAAILDVYQKHTGLTFLTDRDEEIWMPLFAIADVLLPDMKDELIRIAVDMATEKTAAARRYVNLLGEGAEKEAEDDEYAQRLVRDMVTVIGQDKHIYTADAIPRLQALNTGPWRKFRGTGLTPTDLANLLSRFHVQPKLIKTGTTKRGQKPTVLRGYLKKDLEAIAKVQQ